MKNVAICRMKNEIDICEAFARHHAKLFSSLIVIDDFSSDGTYELLQALVDEGLPIMLLRETEVGVPQSVTTTRLMRIAFDQLGADWVAPLDADEFLEVSGGDDLDDVLPQGCKVLVEMRWDNFVWTADSDDGDEVNPVLRLKARMPTRRWHFKVMIPRAVGERHDAFVEEGNHAVTIGKTAVGSVFLDPLRLCHYPIRSIEQFICKTVFGYLRYFQSSDPKAGFHYQEPMRLLKSDMAGFKARMEGISKTYSLGDSNEVAGELRVKPLHYLGGPLNYTKMSACAVLPAICAQLEDAFRQIAGQRREIEVMERVVENFKEADSDKAASALLIFLKRTIEENICMKQKLEALEKHENFGASRGGFRAMLMNLVMSLDTKQRANAPR